MGSSPSKPSHPARAASCWCSRPQAAVRAAPYRAVSVTVAAAGACAGRRVGELERGPVPDRPTAGAGLARRAGKYITRSLRSLLSTSTGRSRSSQASRGRGHTRRRRRPGCPEPVAPVPGGDDPFCDLAELRGGHLGGVVGGLSRTASSGSVHDVRPGSRDDPSIGQPGIICAFPLPRAYVWQNRRSGLVCASGRSQLLTSAASRIRPSAQAGERQRGQ